jgi:hypothetical protein
MEDITEDRFKKIFMNIDPIPGAVPMIIEYDIIKRRRSGGFKPKFIGSYDRKLDNKNHRQDKLLKQYLLKRLKHDKNR